LCLVFGLLAGLGVVAAGFATNAWQAVAIGSPLVLLCGWLTIDAVRNIEDLEGYWVAFERALLDSLLPQVTLPSMDGVGHGIYRGRRMTVLSLSAAT
jgi:hypothetical protein